MRRLYAVVAHHKSEPRKFRMLGIFTSEKSARKSLCIHLHQSGRWNVTELTRAGHERGYNQEFTRYQRDGYPWIFEIYKVPANVDLHYGPIENGLWA